MEDVTVSIFGNDSTTTISLEEYLLIQRGPKHLPLLTAIPLTVINLIIFVTGVVGNIIVCLVIARNSNMHSATNYYLFSLAISDLTLLLFGLPYDLIVYWHQYPWCFGSWFCKFRALLSETASNVSVLTIVAFSMERYLAVCHPLHLYTLSRLSRAIRIITILWIVSLMFATPFAIHTSVYYFDFPIGSGNIVDESAFCGMLEQPKCCPLSEISSILFFFVPMILIVLLYTRMSFKISQRNQYTLGVSVRCSVNGAYTKIQNKAAIIRMLAAVVAAFFMCWAPFHLQRLLYVYTKDNPDFRIINEWMFYITGIFYYASSTVNPILYSVMSRHNRLAFKKTLFGFISPKGPNSLSIRSQQTTFRSQYANNVSNNLIAVDCSPTHQGRDSASSKRLSDENVAIGDTSTIINKKKALRVETANVDVTSMT